MSEIKYRIDDALDTVERHAHRLVDKVTLKAARRPWVFTSCALALGFILGAILV